jgi:hypothetical protein
MTDTWKLWLARVCWSTSKYDVGKLPLFQYSIFANSYPWYQLCLVLFLIPFWGQHWHWNSVLLICRMYRDLVFSWQGKWRFKFSGIWCAADSLIRAPTFCRRENCQLNIMKRDAMPVNLPANIPSLPFLSWINRNVSEWSMDLAIRRSCVALFISISY